MCLLLVAYTQASKNHTPSVFGFPSVCSASSGHKAMCNYPGFLNVVSAIMLKRRQNGILAILVRQRCCSLLNVAIRRMARRRMAKVKTWGTKDALGTRHPSLGYVAFCVEIYFSPLQSLASPQFARAS